MAEAVDGPHHLFVYGTLRAAFDGAMACWLRSVARLMGPATLGGRLYDVAGYPGLVPGPYGRVQGDLFLLPDVPAPFARLDDYEEVTIRHPAPHEYRRERWIVQAADGPVEAWVYVYARDVSSLRRIAGGDFLACTRPAGG